MIPQIKELARGYIHLLDVGLVCVRSQENTVDKDNSYNKMVEPLSTYKSYTKSSDRICIWEKEEGLFFAEPEEDLFSHTLVDETERLKIVQIFKLLQLPCWSISK